MALVFAQVTSEGQPGSATGARGSEPPRLANLEIRLEEHEVLVDGKRVGLTLREFQMIQVLLDRLDRVVTRPEIYSRIWGGQMAYRDRSVDVLVRKTRRKFAHAAPSWIYIHTQFGVGYRFSPERVAR